MPILCGWWLINGYFMKFVDDLYLTYPIEIVKAPLSKKNQKNQKTYIVFIHLKKIFWKIWLK